MKEMNRENDFEDLLRRKANEFELPPSEKVWAGIETNLTARTRKRWLLFLLAACFTFTTAAGLYVFMKTDHESKAKDAAQIEKAADETAARIAGKSMDHSSSTSGAHDQNAMKASLDTVAEKNDAASLLSVSSYNKNETNSSTQYAIHNSQLAIRNSPYLNGDTGYTESNTQDALRSTQNANGNTQPAAEPKEENTGDENANQDKQQVIDAASSSALAASDIAIKDSALLSRIQAALLVEMADSLLSDKSNSQHRFFISAQASPDYAYRFFSDTGGFSKTIHNRYDSITVPILGFTFSVNAGYQFSRHWSLSAGVGYREGGERFKLPGLLVLDTAGSAFDLFDTVNVNYVLRYRYFHFPLMMQYQFGKHRLTYFVTGGIALNVLHATYYKNGTTATYNVASTQSTNTFDNNTYRRVNPELLLGGGVNWNASSRFSLQLDPAFRLFLTPINKNGSNNEYLYSAGINGGIVFHF